MMMRVEKFELKRRVETSKIDLELSLMREKRKNAAMRLC